jgi:hydrogenase small subunit
MFLGGVGPLPQFDELGRPAWMFNETVHLGCVRAGSYEEGDFAEEYGDSKCLVELGCWGPVVQCNMVSRGAIGHTGGCMNTGGICIGCTMPGFPDAFAPFYKKPPGATLSAFVARVGGGFIRPLRAITQRNNNKHRRWRESGEVPSGWGNVKNSGWFDNTASYFYKKLQFAGTKFRPGSTKQKQLQAEAHDSIQRAQAKNRQAAE